MAKAKAKALTLLITGAACFAMLGACGMREDLEPVAGQSPPPLPIGAKTQPTTEELTTPGPQAKPARSDELLKRSERRDPDDFDLPPPG